MRNSFLGYSQKACVKLGLSMDDIALLRWFSDFRDSNKMKRKYDEKSNNMIYWIDYTKTVEDLPIIFNPTSDIKARKKKLQRMLDSNLGKILERVPEKNISKDVTGKGRITTNIYLRLNEENYNFLVEDKNVSHKEDKNVSHKGNDENNDNEPNEEDSTGGQKCPVNKLPINSLPINSLSSSSNEEIKQILTMCNRKLKEEEVRNILIGYSKDKLVKAIIKANASKKPNTNYYGYIVSIIGDIEATKTTTVVLEGKDSKKLKCNNFTGRTEEELERQAKMLEEAML